jgi:hypothetical protein
MHNLLERLLNLDRDANGDGGTQIGSNSDKIMIGEKLRTVLSWRRQGKKLTIQVQEIKTSWQLENAIYCVLWK